MDKGYCEKCNNYKESLIQCKTCFNLFCINCIDIITEICKTCFTESDDNGKKNDS